MEVCWCLVFVLLLVCVAGFTRSSFTMFATLYLVQRETDTSSLCSWNCEEPLPPCFASAVAAALAAKETSSCMESMPSKRDETGVPCVAPSPKLKELPTLRGLSLTSRSESGYFTPRDFHGEGGFFTPRDTEATPPENPQNAPSQTQIRSSQVLRRQI